MIDPDIEEFAELLARLPANEAVEILPRVLREMWATDAPEEIRVMVQDAVIEACNRAWAARDAGTVH
jgi:hypothetical protein